MALILDASVLDVVRQDLADKPDGILETVAENHKVALQTVLNCLPKDAAMAVDALYFAEIWNDFISWGEITFVVHTRDGVFECKGTIPPGSFGRGYFNIHGNSPISGHIKADRCRSIYFVDRPFLGKKSCSIQFISCDGDAMFKVFVGRDKERQLNATQLARFAALRSRFSEVH